MINRKQSLRDHPIIRCPERTQQTDRGTPHTEVCFQQSCCYASLLKSHLGTGAPPQIYRIYPKTFIKRNTSEGLFLMHLQHIVNITIRNLHHIWHNPVVVNALLSVRRVESRTGSKFRRMELTPMLWFQINRLIFVFCWILLWYLI